MKKKLAMLLIVEKVRHLSQKGRNRKRIVDTTFQEMALISLRPAGFFRVIYEKEYSLIILFAIAAMSISLKLANNNHVSISQSHVGIFFSLFLTGFKIQLDRIVC